MPTEMQARPPFVMFDVVAVEDRAATVEQGHYVAKDVVMAYITPQGSKDRVERVATEWFQLLEREVKDGRFPGEWLTAFKRMHQDFLENRPSVVNGVPIVTWPVLSPSQIKMLQNLHVHTVEDLAAANEETVSRLGMGGRSLKLKAQAYLAEQQGNGGKLAEQITALTLENEALKKRNESLETRLAALEAASAKK